MITIIALIPVDNELNIDRTDLEDMTNQEAFKKLYNNRSRADIALYNLSSESYSDPLSQHGICNADEFETDYNDENYDGGYWMRVMLLDQAYVNDVILKSKKMKKYTFRFHTHGWTDVTVMAENEEEAENLANEAYNNGEYEDQSDNFENTDMELVEDE